MAEAFIGFHVSLTLHSGINLTGTVAHIEPSTQQMTLKDGKTAILMTILTLSIVALFFPGQSPHHTPIYGVVGSDIADLQILPTPKNTVPQQQFNVSTIQQPLVGQQPSNSHTHSIFVHEEATDRTLPNTTTNSRTTIVYSFEDTQAPDRPLHQQKQHTTRAQKP